MLDTGYWIPDSGKDYNCIFYPLIEDLAVRIEGLARRFDFIPRAGQGLRLSLRMWFEITIR
jgi:hypothetical protein